MDARLPISPARTKNWHVREAEAEEDVRNGEWPGAWRPGDQPPEPDSQTDAPCENGDADSE